MLNTNFEPWPCFSEEEANKAKEILLSNKVNYWTGNECRKFEKEFATWNGSKYAVALANGTLAIDAALKALNIGIGDEVISTPRTFLATISSIVNAGAKAIFSDIDRVSQNITAEHIEKVITKRTKAIIVVHLAGQPAEMDGIMKLAEANNLFVIEDCAQAHGAKYKGNHVGSIGHVGTWSFCQDKIMTTGGEGGMITTSNSEIWEKIWSFKDHGKSWEAVYEREHPPGFRWVHDSFGTNWRMTEIQAAIGRLQLEKMDEWTRIRTSNANKIINVCKKYPFLIPPDIKCKACDIKCLNEDECVHAFYKLYILIDSDVLNCSRDEIMAKINAHGVPCYSGSCSEVYLEKAFDGTDMRPNVRLINAKWVGENCLMFLVHPGLSEDSIDKTCAVLEKVMSEITSNNI